MDQPFNIRALTIYQPYAALIAGGVKQFETRTWDTKYRGVVAVHASINLAYANLVVRAPFYELIHKAGILINEIAFGAVVGLAFLLSTHEIPNHSLTKIGPYAVSELERSLGFWTADRVAWRFISPMILDEPLPAKGQQGLWRYDMPGSVIQDYLARKPELEQFADLIAYPGTDDAAEC